MAFLPGDRVLVRARVQNAPKADREEAYQTYSLILTDGQNLQTNVKNLEAIEQKAEGDVAETKFKRGDRITWDGKPGVFQEKAENTPCGRVKLDDGRILLVELAAIEEEKAKPAAAKAMTQPPQHKALRGPREPGDGP